MKKLLSFALATGLIAFVISCSDEVNNTTQEQSTSTIDMINKQAVAAFDDLSPDINTTIAELDVSYKEHLAIPSKIDAILNTNPLKTQTNIVHLFLSEDHTVKGVGVHYYSFDAKAAYYDLFDVKGTQLISKEGFPYVVNHFQFDDLVFYLSPKYFTNAPIVAIHNTLNAIEPANNDYNELSLARTMHMLKTAQGRSILAEYRAKQSRSGCSGPCSVSQSPACANTVGNQCRSHGCICIECPKKETEEEITAARFSNEEEILAMFKNERYYQFRDLFLLKSDLGSYYTDVFYAIAGQYKHTISYDYLVEFVEMLPKMNAAIDNLLNDRYKGKIMDEELYGHLKSLLSQSIENSSDSHYKVILNDFKELLNDFTGKTRAEIYTMLEME